MKTHLGPPTRDFDASEFVLVVALAFGLSILGSLSAALSYTGKPVTFDDAELITGIVFELITAPIVWLVLRSRGWKWTDFAVHYSRGSTILGVILAAGILAVWVAFEAAFGKVPSVTSAGLVSVTILSIINPLYEELLVLAFVVQALRKRFGLTTAFNVSLAIRLVYHLYQGPLAVIPIAFFGLVMTLVYVRMGRLWPCIVAHGILDFVALADLI
jgi:membrane protease YdiL (CAAX protease family)